MSKKLTQKEFEQLIEENFGNKYSVVTLYTGTRKPITLHCNIHNTNFTANAECFMRKEISIKSDCPICAIERRKKQNTLSECICAYCNQKFYRNPSKLLRSRSGLYFCCREHKDLAQRLDSGSEFDQMRPLHYSTIGEEGEATLYTYRAVSFKAYPHQCAICGWKEDEDILQVHHIDENRQNNKLENLIILCPNCHAKLTSHKYILVNRNQIVLNGA